MWSVRNKIIVLGVVLLGSIQPVLSQSHSEIIPKRNSPYSRFGLGDPVTQYYAAQTGMAGMPAAFHNHSRSNLVNPAALAWMRFTAFEVGISARRSALADGQTGASTELWSGNLRNLTLAFPLRNSINQVVDRRRAKFNWGMAFSLQPYTEVGYNVEVEEPLGAGDSENGDTYLNSLKGTGGTYRLVWGNGFRYENLSVGFTVGYLFGQITNSRRVSLGNVAPGASYASEFLDEISVRGLTWSAGAQYKWVLERDEETNFAEKSITFGAYGNSATSFNTKTDQFYARDNRAIAQAQDTLVFNDNAENTGQLPSQFGFGAMYEEMNKIRLGVDASFTNWSQYENGAKPETLANAYRFAAGAEWIPDIESYNNYLQKIRYRLGLFYGTDPRTVNGQQLSEYGLSLGIGLPLVRPRQQTSFIDLALEVGQFGLPEAVRDTYIQMTVGFTLNDNTWFFKRKFN